MHCFNNKLNGLHQQIRKTCGDAKTHRVSRTAHGQVVQSKRLLFCRTEPVKASVKRVKDVVAKQTPCVTSVVVPTQTTPATTVSIGTMPSQQHVLGILIPHGSRTITCHPTTAVKTVVTSRETPRTTVRQAVSRSRQ